MVMPTYSSTFDVFTDFSMCIFSLNILKYVYSERCFFSNLEIIWKGNEFSSNQYKADTIHIQFIKVGILWQDKRKDFYWFKTRHIVN